MVKLFQFSRNRHTHNFSPFCLKLETYLLMTKVPYEVHTWNDPRKAPNGKLPFIEDGAMRMGDSGLIIEYLKKQYGDSLDSKLSAEARAMATALTRLFESDLMFVLMYSRWIDERGWSVVRSSFFRGLPPPMKWFVPTLIQKGVKKTLHGQGISRHAREEIYQIGAEDIDAASVLLGDKPYFLGASPTTVDATAYGFLNNVLNEPFDSPLKTEAKRHKNLEAFVSRIKAAYYASGEKSVIPN